MDVSSMNRTMPGAYGTDKAPKKMTDEKSAFMKAAKGAPGSMGLGGEVMRSVPSTAQGPAQGDGFGYPLASPGVSVPTSPSPFVQSLSQERIHGRPVAMTSGERAYSEVLLKRDIGAAIAKGDTQTVEDLIKGAPHDFDINAMHNKAGGTTLHEAVVAGKGDIVRFLVDHAGIDMAELDSRGKSAYQVADDKAKASGDPADRATADYLRGRMTDELKRAALDGNYNRAGELIKAGADASILPGGGLGTREQFIKADDNFSFFLRDAIRKGDTEAVQTLLKDPPKGWDINNVGTGVAGIGSGGDTLLQFVARGGLNASNEGTIRALIDNSSIDLAKLDPSGKSAYQSLEDYAKASHSPAAQRCADFARDKMNGGLGRAMFDGNLDRAGALIKAGAQPNAEIAPGVTALSWAAATGNPDLIRTIVDTIPPENLKAELNKKGVNGVTALHAAAEAGNRDVYDYLKSKGADDMIKNDAGTAPRDMLNKLQPRSGSGGWKSIPEEGVILNLANAAAIGLNELLDMIPSGRTGVDPSASLPPITSPAETGGGAPATGTPSPIPPLPATQQFTNDPSQYAGTHFIGAVAADRSIVHNGDTVAFTVDPTTPGVNPPMLPALGGRAPGAIINATPVENPGPNTATWLSYRQDQTQQVDTQVIVPAHPTGNQARFVLTPAVTGCAFYATSNPADPTGQTIIFHHLSGPTNGLHNPVVPSGGVGIGSDQYGPQNYGQGTTGGAAGNGPNPYGNVVAPYAHYDDNARQWVIQGQPYGLPADSRPATAQPFNQSTGRPGLGGFTIPIPSHLPRDRGL